MADSDYPDDLIKRLAEYAVAYMTEFNLLRRDLVRAGNPASLYGEELTGSAILVGKDGIVVFFVTERERERCGFQRGVLAIDSTDESMTHITQDATNNTLKITASQPGDSVFTEPMMPEDIPESELRGSIQIELLEPFVKRGIGTMLLGIVVGPTWHVENGIRVHQIPTRKRVFSPFIPVPPDERPVLQFVFPFIDLIWGLDKLQLDAEAGKHFARTDIDVLLLGIAAGIPPKQLAEDPFDSVAAHCGRRCDEFLALIDNPASREDAVQTFLEQPGNQFLIAPHAQAIYPHKPLGGNRFIPDFTVHRPDGDYHFVEIESPNAPIYQIRGQEPTSEFNHAIVQTEDWLRYIDQNLLSVRIEDKMPTLYKPTAEVVIGRDKHLGDTARTRFEFKRAESIRIEYKTYDMLVASGRAYAASVRRLKEIG